MPAYPRPREGRRIPAAARARSRERSYTDSRAFLPVRRPPPSLGGRSCSSQTGDSRYAYFLHDAGPTRRKLLAPWAAWILCAVSAASCSRDGLGGNQARDAAAGGFTGVGGAIAVGGAPGTGGASGAGGVAGTGGATGAGGVNGVGGATGTGGASGVGGATGGTFVPPLDGSVGGTGAGGLRGTGGVVGFGGTASGGSGSGGVSGRGGFAAGGSAAGGSIADSGVDAAVDAPARPDTHSADLPLSASTIG